MHWRSQWVINHEPSLVAASIIPQMPIVLFLNHACIYNNIFLYLSSSLSSLLTLSFQRPLYSLSLLSRSHLCFPLRWDSSASGYVQWSSTLPPFPLFMHTLLFPPRFYPPHLPFMPLFPVFSAGSQCLILEEDLQVLETFEFVLFNENDVSICDANQMKVFALYLILGWKCITLLFSMWRWWMKVSMGWI